jgi:hypothetical protein
MIKLTPEDLALNEEGAAPDLPLGMPPAIALLQPVSAQLQPGSKSFVEGSAPGDFLDPYQGAYTLVKRSAGIVFVPVAFEVLWPEYQPFRQGYVTTHPDKPANAVWLKKTETVNGGVRKPASPDGKEGNYLIDADGKPGNRIEQTLYTHMLVLPNDGRAAHGATFRFRSKSLAIGFDFARPAERLQVTIDGQTLKGPVVGKWGMTSRGEGTYLVPVPRLIGKLGESKGPTQDQWRLAARLRAGFKQGAPLAVEGPPEPPEPPIVSPVAPRLVITSGRDVNPAWDGALQPPPPIDEVPEGPDNGVDDSIEYDF